MREKMGDGHSLLLSLLVVLLYQCHCFRHHPI